MGSGRTVYHFPLMFKELVKERAVKKMLQSIGIAGLTLVPGFMLLLKQQVTR